MNRTSAVFVCLTGVILASFFAGALCGCEPKEEKAPPSPKLSPPQPKGPRRLFLPTEEREHSVDISSARSEAEGDVTFSPGGSELPTQLARGNCPPEMVDVGGKFCIDRFEVHLVEAKTGQELSPHYPPNQHYTNLLFERWTRKAPSSGRALGRELSVPTPPEFQLKEDFKPRARSARGRTPAGYLTRGLAELACTNAGKRLCRRNEWVEACRGQKATKFPYGNRYEEKVCNVHRESHPARLLHGDASRNHLDPRLGLAEDDDGPLLRQTGESSACVSRWGSDGIYDMVGNLDEWVADPSGAFLGGFYSRGTTEGCDASIDSHDPGYLDYSLGTRCCVNPGN